MFLENRFVYKMVIYPPMATPIKSSLFLLILSFYLSPVAGSEEIPLRNKQGLIAEFELFQRHNFPISQIGGNYLVHLGDITGGQVEFTLLEKNGKNLVGPLSLREGEAVQYTIASITYEFKIKKLTNRLIHDDWAMVQVFRVAAGAPAPTTPDLGIIIATLISEVGKLDGVLIRNNKSYTPKEAAAFIRKKFALQEGRIKSVEEFINNVCAHSNESKLPYKIKFHHGGEQDLAPWLLGRWEKLKNSSR